MKQYSTKFLAGMRYAVTSLIIASCCALHAALPQAIQQTIATTHEQPSWATRLTSKLPLWLQRRLPASDAHIKIAAIAAALGGTALAYQLAPDIYKLAWDIAKLTGKSLDLILSNIIVSITLSAAMNPFH